MNLPPNEKSPAATEKPASGADFQPLFDLEELAEFFDLNEAAEPDAAAEKTGGAAGEKYVVFDLGETSYAVHSHRVVEVFAAPAVAPLPNAPAWLAGIAALRGEIMAVVNLRRLWFGQIETPQRMKAIVLRSSKSDARAAFLVDKLNEIVTLSSQDIKFSAADFEASLPAIFGRASSGGRQLFLLDVEQVFASLVFENSPAL